MRIIPPVPPGAVIGYHADGRPVRLIAGGSEPVPEPVPQPEPALPAPQPEPVPEPAGQAEPDPRAVDELPDWARREFRSLRAENAASRTKLRDFEHAQAAREKTREAEQQQWRDGIAKVLGITPDAPTPEQLTERLTTAAAERDAERARARATAVELAAFRAAAAAGADPNKVLDSRAFVATLDGLDPADPGFGQQVTDKVTAAVEASPGWKLTPQPVSQAGSQPGPQPGPQAGPQAPPQAGAYPPAAAAQPYLTPPPLAPPAIPASGPQGSFTAVPPGPRQLTEADSLQMTPRQVQEAINAGLFREAGFGPGRRR